jgi:hypothetical protein
VDVALKQLHQENADLAMEIALKTLGVDTFPIHSPIHGPLALESADAFLNELVDRLLTDRSSFNLLCRVFRPLLIELSGRALLKVVVQSCLNIHVLWLFSQLLPILPQIIG